MSTGRPGPVVVGVDHSPASDAAITQAAWEAKRRGLGLRLVHATVEPVPTLTPLPPYYDDNERLIATETQFAAATAWVRSAFPDLETSTKVVARSGGQALVDESQTASLVVVGARGQGGFTGVLLGSVAAQVATYARCPVIVARRQVPGTEPPPEAGAVLAGIDGSARSVAALSFAFDEAAARDVPLIAVHVWSVPEMSALSTGTVWSSNLRIAQGQLREAAEDVLTQALAGWEQEYPQVRVRRLTVHGDAPARTLLEVTAETGAGLIVVASRGRHGVAGMLLGSVSQTLVAYAGTSVAVIHPEPANA